MNIIHNPLFIEHIQNIIGAILFGGAITAGFVFSPYIVWFLITFSFVLFQYKLDELRKQLKTKQVRQQ